jgi:predicted dehydrogenase
MSSRKPASGLSRRGLLASAGSLGLAGAALAGGVRAQGLPGPSEVDTGRVENGKVVFPEWKGAADRPSAPPPKPLPDSERVGFAIAGLGRLALEEVLPAFGETLKAKPVALVSGTPDKAKAVAAQYGIPESAVYSYEDMGRLRENAGVGAVYVITPNGLHLRDVTAAAGAGKHVLCEKPMAVSSAEAEAMVAACRQAKVKLMIAYRVQYEPFNREAMRLLRSGDYGAARIIEASNTQVQGTGDQWRFRKALAGGGSLPDIGLYCLNTARAYTGEEPVEVFARIFNPPGDERYREVEETIAFTLRFPSGILANCAASYGAHEAKDFRLRCERATIDVPNAFAYRGQGLRLYQRRDDAEGITEVKLTPKNQFALEIDHFATCILEDRDPHTPGEEGLQDHRLMEALYRSAATGQPVALDAPAKKDAFRGPPPEET